MFEIAKQKPAILIIDDDEQIRKLLKQILGGENDCTAVGSAEDALTVLDEANFDVVISDITALTIAAEGGKADISKPMRGLGSGVFEIALAFRGDAFRVIYSVQLGEDIWLVHAFQKKSKRGIKTPKHEIDLVKDRLKRLKEMLR